MNKPIYALLLGAGLLATATSARAQVTKNLNGYLLRVKYTKGTSIQLVATNKIGGPKGSPGAGMTFQMPVTMDVVDVKNGISTVRIKVGAASMGNQQMTAARTAVVLLDNRNKAQQQALPALSTTLPLQAVRVGTSWVAKAPVALGAGEPGKMTATYTFAGLKTVRGRPVAVINFKVNGAAQGSGTEYLLVSDGTLFGSEFDLQLNMAEAKGLSVHSSLVRK